MGVERGDRHAAACHPSLTAPHVSYKQLFVASGGEMLGTECLQYQPCEYVSPSWSNRQTKFRVSATRTPFPSRRAFGDAVWGVERGYRHAVASPRHSVSRVRVFPVQCMVHGFRWARVKWPDTECLPRFRRDRPWCWLIIFELVGIYLVPRTVESRSYIRNTYQVLPTLR